MYPSTFREDMPCGRGFEWYLRGTDTYFTKKMMSCPKISLESVQWMEYMSDDPRFVDRNGERCKIISGWSSEEVKVGNFELDGYCKVDDIEYALEYDGCYWHGCVQCGHEGKSTARVSYNSIKL